MAMAERTFTITTEVPATPQVALDFLADLPRHQGLHPFLVSAVVVGESGDSVEWAVHERPSWGPVRYSVRFRARLARPAPGELRSAVTLPPGVRLDSRTLATEGPGATGGARIVETTTVTAPWPLLGYVARNAERAHARTFSLLPGELSG